MQPIRIELPNFVCVIDKVMNSKVFPHSVLAQNGAFISTMTITHTYANHNNNHQMMVNDCQWCQYSRICVSCLQTQSCVCVCMGVYTFHFPCDAENFESTPQFKNLTLQKRFDNNNNNSAWKRKCKNYTEVQYSWPVNYEILGMHYFFCVYFSMPFMLSFRIL